MDPRYAEIYRLAPELAETLEPAELATIEHALAEADPDVKRTLDHWMKMREHISGELAADIPPPGLIALFAVGEEPDALTDDEWRRLDEARKRVEAALVAHPGLQSVVERVRADRDAFYTLWEADERADARDHARVDRAAMAPSRPAARRSRWVSRVAITAAVALFAAALIFIAQRDVGFETVETADGETRDLVLPDGSEVRLAPNTTLAYRLPSVGERRVRLTGEGLFDVVATGQSFVVETHEALVHVVGTTFNVSSDAMSTEVVLVEGAVDVRARLDPEQVVRLDEGQRSRVIAGRAPEAPEPVDVADALAWTGNWYFRAAPLGQITTRLERAYGVRIIVPAELAEEGVSGAFRQDAPVEETLRTLATALGTEVEEQEPGVFRFAAVSS